MMTDPRPRPGRRWLRALDMIIIVGALTCLVVIVYGWLFPLPPSLQSFSMTNDPRPFLAILIGSLGFLLVRAGLTAGPSRLGHAAVSLLGFVSLVLSAGTVLLISYVLSLAMKEANLRWTTVLYRASDPWALSFIATPIGLATLLGGLGFGLSKWQSR